jgi:gluconolactonase
MTMVIILGGILSGVFTANESTSVAVLWAFIVTMFVYRDYQWRDLPRLMYRTVRTVTIVTILIGLAACFTDPPFGILGWWEGEPAEPELPQGVYRIDAASGELTCALDDLAGPNGLAFTPDERVLYVVESRSKPHRLIWAYDVAGDKLTNKRLFVSANGPGAFDGIAVDHLGNVWCGLGSDGTLAAKPAELDGVRVYDPAGVPLAHIHLPERCANLCFVGPKRNRLFMAASHSLYALHVNVRGEVA